MNYVKDLASQALAAVKALYAREPARVNAAVLAAATAIGIPVVIGGVSVAAVLVPVIALLLGGEVTRAKVTPVKKRRKR